MKFSELEFVPTDNDPNVARAVFTSIWGRSACFRHEMHFANQTVTYEIIGCYGNIPPRFANVHYKNLTETGVQTILDACWRPEGWVPEKTPAPTQAEVEAVEGK